MQHSRTLAAFMGSALLALVLSACGPDDTSSSGDASSTVRPTHSASRTTGGSEPSKSASAKVPDATANVNEPDPSSMDYVCDVIGDLSTLVGQELVTDNMDADLAMAHPARVGNCAFGAKAYGYYLFSVMYAGKELMAAYELPLGRGTAGYKRVDSYGPGAIVNDTNQESPTYAIPNGDRVIVIDTGNFSEYLKQYGNGVSMEDVIKHIVKRFSAVKH